MSKSLKWHERIPRWLWITAVPTCLSIIVISARGLVTYVDLPKRVEAGEVRVSKIEEYIEAQQKMSEIQAEANNLMREQIQRQQYQPYCEYDDQGALWCWDESRKTWYRGGQ